MSGGAMMDARCPPQIDLPPRLGVWLVALAPLAYFWRATSGQILLASGDALLYFFPMRRLAAQFLAAGYLPLWNPYIFSGFPFLAVSQMAVLHPGTWLFLVLPPVWAMNVQVLATFVIAGLGTYAYCRAVRSSVFGATVAGLTFPFAGFMLGHLGHTGLVQAAVWLPAVLYCVERLRHRAALRWVAGGAAAIALAIVAGHPQMPAMSLFTAAAYAAFFSLAERPPAGRRRYLACCAAMFGGGVLLGAVQLLPTAELAAQSLRVNLSFDDFAAYALPLAQLPMLLFPYLFGGDGAHAYWGAWSIYELLGYVGMLPPMLALAALPLARRDRVVQFWLLLAALAGLLTLGAATPLARVMYHVPVWNLFRGAARTFLQFDLALAVLAALGATHAVARYPARLRGGALAVAAVTALTALVAVFAGAWLWRPQAARAGLDPTQLAALLAWDNPAIWQPLLCAAAAALVLLALARHPRRALLLVALAVLAADLVGFGRRLPHPMLRAWRVGAPTDYIRWLTANGADAAHDRIALINTGVSRAVRLDLALWDLPIINGYEPLMLSRYSEFAAGMSYFGSIPDTAIATRPLFLDLLNTTYLVTVLPSRTELPLGAVPSDQPFELTLRAGESLEFALLQPQRTTRVDVVSSLSGSPALADGTPVARLVVEGADGARAEAMLTAGADTAEWAWDRADVRDVIRHRRAEVFESFAADGFAGHRYVARVALPVAIVAQRVRVEALAPYAELLLTRLSLVDEATGARQHLTALQALGRDPQRWESVFTGELVEIRRNHRALPRAWLVPAVRPLAAAQIVAAVRDGRLPDGTPFDPRAVALVDGAPAADYPPLDAAATVEVVRYEPNLVELRSRSATPAFLVLSEVDFPGWQATVDDAAVPIVRTDGVLRGLPLPAGEHVVRFAYRPRSVQVGAGISAATALLFAGAGAWSLRRGVGGGRG
ncbi:MAG: hypothetical protein ACRERC_25425 [Candidatus Binatia bacterium]